jgi:moderate conductance mechanosensitive channel
VPGRSRLRPNNVLRPFLACLLLLAVAAAAAAIDDVNAAEPDTIEALISVLEDPEARERLLERLRSLPEIESGQTAAGATADPATASLPRQIAQFTQQVAEGSVAEVRNQIKTGREILGSLQDANWVAFGMALLDLLIVIAVTVGVFLVLRRFARPLFAALDRWVLDSNRTMVLLRTVPAVLLAALPSDLLVVVLAWVVGIWAGVVCVLGEAGTSWLTRHSLFLNAFLLIEDHEGCWCACFSPAATQGLRVLPMAGEEAAYWNAWLSRIGRFHRLRSAADRFPS